MALLLKEFFPLIYYWPTTFMHVRVHPSVALLIV